jgi:hypothetical protein
MPLLRERVELRKQLRFQRPRRPAPLQVIGELLRPAAVRERDLLDPLGAPELRDLGAVDGNEHPRMTTAREIAEDAAVEPELRLGDEMQQVVRQPRVVTGRGLEDEIRRPVTTHVDAVSPFLLDEGDAH